MPNIIEISDLSERGVEAFSSLTESQLRSRREPEKGIFIAEGVKVIEHALDAGCVPLSLLMERRHIAGKAAKLIERCGEIPVYTAQDSVLSALTGYELTRGVLCAMKRPLFPDAERICANARRIAVLEGIVDPTNVGAIFRCAAAMGIDAVLLTPTCCDALNRRAVRVSMGTLFQVPWAKIGTGPSDWPGPGLELLNRLGFKTAAMALSENALSIEDKRLASEEKLAIILGTEGDGLSAGTIAQCDYTVMIPMEHGVDSLNVAAASAVAFFQLRVKK